MIRILPGQPLPLPRTEYETAAVQFCSQWLAGETTFMLHTSGSTGVPKPIELTRRQMVASAHATGRALGLQPCDEALCCLNVRYIAGVMMLVRGMELSLPLTVVEPSADPFVGVDTSYDRPFAFTALVPLQLQTLLDRPVEGLRALNQMKAILVGGAPVSTSLEASIQAVKAPVYSTYGMTETVSHIALRRLNGELRSDVYSLLDGLESGSDQRNCLWVQGEVTNGEVVQTNDVVDWVQPGAFRWLGRFDSIINSGGVKIMPEKVERCLGEELTNVNIFTRSFVCGTPDERLGSVVTAVIESDPPDPTILANLQKAMAERVNRYELPRRWLFLTTFKETPTGKIDRLATLRLAQPSPGS